jgi:N-acetylmuramoyl-L-alanine amidase-like
VVAALVLAGGAGLALRAVGTGARTASAEPVERGPGPWLDSDWNIFRSKVEWAARQGLDTVPLPTAIAAIGRSFVGTPYVPHTLEADGPEHLVIDFRGLDCVTFVENSFALARFVTSGGQALLADRPAAEARYGVLLEQLRYRDGVIDGYPSRLHYFSDWIADNARRGLVTDVTREIGGVRDDEPIDFMTTHTDAYRQLSDPANVERLREVEQRLTEAGHWYVPQDRIAAVSDRIQDGDIIAVTSTVSGLDVAHTGIALWVDGSLRLLNAPLVGDSVQISELSLADRVLGIKGQDGILVARPVDR